MVRPVFAFFILCVAFIAAAKGMEVGRFLNKQGANDTFRLMMAADSKTSAKEMIAKLCRSGLNNVSDDIDMQVPREMVRELCKNGVNATDKVSTTAAPTAVPTVAVPEDEEEDDEVPRASQSSADVTFILECVMIGATVLLLMSSAVLFYIKKLQSQILVIRPAQHV